MVLHFLRSLVCPWAFTVHSELPESACWLPLDPGWCLRVFSEDIDLAWLHQKAPDVVAACDRRRMT